MNSVDELNDKFDKVILLLEKTSNNTPTVFNNVITTIIAASILGVFSFVWGGYVKMGKIENRLEQTERVRIKGWKAIDYNFKVLNTDGKYIFPIYDPEDKTRSND
jgi:hypothetical protein